MIIRYPEVYTNPIERERAKAEQVAAEIEKAKATQVKMTKPTDFGDIARATLAKMGVEPRRKRGKK